MIRYLSLLLAVAILPMSVAAMATTQSSERGRREYEARCVGCHGADGAGAGHGPSIVDLRRSRATIAATKWSSKWMVWAQNLLEAFATFA